MLRISQQTLAVLINMNIKQQFVQAVHNNQIKRKQYQAQQSQQAFTACTIEIHVQCKNEDRSDNGLDLPVCDRLEQTTNGDTTSVAF